MYKTPIQINSYLGFLGKIARKYAPKFTAYCYLRLSYLLRSSVSKRYIRFFMSQEIPPKPLLLNIETINRCNSTCNFCPANKNSEKRPFAKMDRRLFEHIINDLADWGYKGYVSLYINNEPLMDNRIFDFARYSKEKLPEAKLLLFSNGLLLNIEKLKLLSEYVDILYINNYTDDFSIPEHLNSIIDYVNSHQNEFRKIKIFIQQRYLKEILTNRAGSAPNKGLGKRPIRQPCLMPFTDLNIYPNGVVGLCCNDCYEQTNLGNVKDSPISVLWGGGGCFPTCS